eukprot:scaffold508003_cov41-Prasinocladus_malaysianus.AAC.2
MSRGNSSMCEKRHAKSIVIRPTSTHEAELHFDGIDGAHGGAHCQGGELRIDRHVRQVRVVQLADVADSQVGAMPVEPVQKQGIQYIYQQLSKNLRSCAHPL